MNHFRYRDNNFDITGLLDVKVAKSLIAAIKETQDRCRERRQSVASAIWENLAFTSNCCKVLSFKQLRPNVAEQRSPVMIYGYRGIGGAYCSMRPLFDIFASYSTIKAYLSFSSYLDDAHFNGHNIADYGVNIPLDYILEHCIYKPKDIVIRTCITLQKKLH